MQKCALDRETHKIKIVLGLELCNFLLDTARIMNANTHDSGGVIGSRHPANVAQEVARFVEFWVTHMEARGKCEGDDGVAALCRALPSALPRERAALPDLRGTGAASVRRGLYKG